MPGGPPHRPVRAQHGGQLPAPRHGRSRDLQPVRARDSRRRADSWWRPVSSRAWTSSSRSRSPTTSWPRSARWASTIGRSRTSRPLRFSGEVWAVPEGRVVYSEEPLLEVTAPVAVAQVVETVLLNQITLHTTLASKAARYVLAAEGRAARRLRLPAHARRRGRDGDRTGERPRGVRRDVQRRGGPPLRAHRARARWRTRSSRRSRPRVKRSAPSPRTTRTGRRSSSTPTTRWEACVRRSR